MIDKKLYYNTLRSPLILPEYGRHIQAMVEYLKTIPTKEERNRLAEVVIQVMRNSNSTIKDTPEHTHKLWNQLAQIANYELDIDYPVPIYKKEDFTLHRKKISYPKHDTQLKHYGKISEMFAKALALLPESEERNQLLTDLANHMKKQYVLYNKEAVSDEQILNDIRNISQMVDLKLPEIKLNETRDILHRNKKNNSSNKKNKRHL